jgi:hypothetical protein
MTLGFGQSCVIVVSPLCCCLKLNVICKQYLITGSSEKNQSSTFISYGMDRIENKTLGEGTQTHRSYKPANKNCGEDTQTNSKVIQLAS